jgi:hypothetical protein
VSSVIKEIFQDLSKSTDKKYIVNSEVNQGDRHHRRGMELCLYVLLSSCFTVSNRLPSQNLKTILAAMVIPRHPCMNLSLRNKYKASPTLSLYIVNSEVNQGDRHHETTHRRGME